MPSNLSPIPGHKLHDIKHSTHQCAACAVLFTRLSDCPCIREQVWVQCSAATKPQPNHICMCTCAEEIPDPQPYTPTPEHQPKSQTKVLQLWEMTHQRAACAVLFTRLSDTPCFVFALVQATEMACRWPDSATTSRQTSDATQQPQHDKPQKIHSCACQTLDATFQNKQQP
jgi:hypothetical protein